MDLIVYVFRVWALVAFAAFCLAAGLAGPGSPAARADTTVCAQTASAGNPAAPTAGNPCWTDVVPYPFGADGNPVDTSAPSCNPSTTPFGQTWAGDFNPPQGGGPGCYLRPTSLAFRAWNRGLAATTFTFSPRSGSPNPFGVWLFNGTSWFPDPTFPGSSVCPGDTVLWAGKLDYWLIGGFGRNGQTLCRFDGINFIWEPLKLPAATLARLPIQAGQNAPTGGVTAGACYAWNDCWFLGDDGIVVHWDGTNLADAPGGVGTSPWLEGDFTAAVAGTDPAGQRFGLAAAKNTAGGLPGHVPLQPDGTPPPELFGSRGGPFAPLAFTPQPANPFATDLVTVAADSLGDAWVAGAPSLGSRSTAVPLLRMTEAGAPATCPDYDAATFSTTTISGWGALSVFPSDGSVLAAAAFRGPRGLEPAIVRGVCGQPASITRFVRPDPSVADQSAAPPVPADQTPQGVMTVGANATNDAWASTPNGQASGFVDANGGHTENLKPHLYRYTDGQPPAAPAGDDSETRPSLFTLDAPVYVPAPPTTIVITTTPPSTSQRGRTKARKLKPAIYAVTSSLKQPRNGELILYISFKVRRPVTIGVEALRGRAVVASSGVKHFRGPTGTLALILNRSRWPTRLKFVVPRKAATDGSTVGA
jgi:hypothetical protein